MKKVLSFLTEFLTNTTMIAISVALAIAIILPLINQLSEKVVDKMKGEEELGGSFATEPETIIGIAPTSTAISTYNTEDVATSTPTTTDYFSLGPNVSKAYVNFIVNATSSDIKSFLFSYEVSGNLTSSTTLANFYTLLNPSSGTGKTYTIASTTNLITLPSGGTFYKLTIPLCSNAYDGTDDIPTCNVGLYKFQVGRVGLSGIEVYAEIDRE